MFVTLPVLLSSTPGWPFVVELLDGPDVEASGANAATAMQRLERRLQRLSKQNRIQPSTEWTSGELFTKSFPIQPMYVHHGRRYLAGPSMQFPVRYIRLLDDRGSLYCLLPDLGTQFFCPEERLFPTMLSETVRSVTATMEPNQVVEFWPPSSSELRWVRVRVPKLHGEIFRGPRVKAIRSVAEPFVQKSIAWIALESQLRAKSDLEHAIGQGSCLVVGEPGVGKTTLLMAAARKFQRDKKAEWKSLRRTLDPARVLSIPSFWSTSGGRLIAGMQYLGQWQERMELVISELSDNDGILVIENLRDLLSLGGTSPQDSIGAFMLPYIRNGQLRVLIETTPDEQDACRQLLPSFLDSLPVVHVDPLWPDQERELIERRLALDARNRKSVYDPALPSLIQRWCSQYQRQASPPGPSSDFVRALIASRPDALTIQVAVDRFIKRTGLPEAMIRDEWLLTREDVSKELQREVIGQDHACDAAAGLITRIKSAMNDPLRPFGCVLLCGPTGVGKTQLAKSLAKYLYGHGEGRPVLVRLDMSEYSGIASGHRFLLDEHHQPASWIQKIRNRPLSVLLLDEIEKAGSEVFDILLSLLDEGRLTDRFGRVTSFRNTVVLMTSNLGVRQSTSVGFGGDASPDYVSEIRKAFRPEFFNRLDQVIPFHPLDHSVILQITRKEFEEIQLREGIVRHRLKLAFTDRLVEKIATIGFHSRLGARPLQRAIESQVVAPLAKWWLEHPLADQQLSLDWDSMHDRLSVIPKQ